MNEILKWFSMGGYSAYIWPAYGLVSMTLCLIFFTMKSQKKQVQQTLQQWFKSES